MSAVLELVRPPSTAPLPGPLPLRAPRPLTFATYLAPSLHPLYAYLAAHVGAVLERPTRLIVGSSFLQLSSGEVDFAFLCSLPYIRMRAADPASIAPIAAPVLTSARCKDRPWSFSDVIVHADSPIRTFSQLQGRTWAYKDPDSTSGWLATLAHLQEQGLTPDFFAKRIRTDFHINSIRTVATGVIDASAIDSHVLAIAVRDDPTLLAQIRIIDSFGPYSIQPLAAAGHVPLDLQESVRGVITGLASGRDSTLGRSLVHHFVPINDNHYDDIRAMLKAVEELGWQL
jgi:phosphonate transport system substrate-binding protein